MRITITFDKAVVEHYDIEAPKVKHLAQLSSRLRGIQDPTETDSIAVLLEVLTGGELSADRFMESEASNLARVSGLLSPFLS